MDSKQKIKNIKKLVKKRVELLREFDELKIYKEKFKKEQGKYEGKN